RERTPPMLDTRNHVLRPAALEDEWVVAYSTAQPGAWPEERFTSDVWQDPSDLLQAALPPGALLGSEVAAARLGAPIRPAEALVRLPPEARREFIRQGRLRRAPDGLIRARPAFWKMPPEGTDGLAPRPLLRADLLLEDDPRIDEIRAQLFGDAR
ncbi:MAG: type IV toxin-antitoxin system AbiEi family antitoxin, partial [Brachybacterium sp.]|nr:type IV toxin-antitoxin system AbiEi family antitoxin [Brachybacterium sp.]